MKIKSTIRVELNSPDGNAIFTFKRAKLNEQLQAMAEAEKIKDLPQHEKIRKDFSFIMDRLISVEGLTDEEGKPITAEEVKNLGLDMVTMLAVVTAYVEAGIPKESAEKKDSASA